MSQKAVLNHKDSMGIQRIDETPVHKVVREAFVNLIIPADYLMDAGVLKVIKGQMASSLRIRGF